MQQDKRVNFQDLDQVLLNAQLRRSADIGLWLKPYFEERRQARSRRESPVNPTTTFQRRAS
jgi:hypothetical protein